MERHLDTHDHSDIAEALTSASLETKKLLAYEQQLRGDQFNWLAALPAILWSMRTAVSSSRGASPYMIVFGRHPASSLDNLYGLPLQQENFDNSAEFLRARTRRDQLTDTFTKLNIAEQIDRQKKYYVAKSREFHKGDLCYIFTPELESNVSQKFMTFWAGPYVVDHKFGVTTYRVKPGSDKFGGGSKPIIVTIDRMKEFKPSDPVVTPPLSFKGFPTSDPGATSDPEVEHLRHVPEPAPVHIKKILDKQDKEALDSDNLEKASLPWESHVKDNIPMPDSSGAWPKETVKKISLEQYKKRKNSPKSSRPLAKKFVGLPAPPVTRSQTRAQGSQVGIAALSEPIQDPEFQISEVTEPYSDQYDHFMYHRQEFRNFYPSF